MSKTLKTEQTLEKGAFLLLFSTLLAKIISAVFVIPLSMDFCLGDLGFGYFSAVHDLFVPISTLAVSGFPIVVSKLVAEKFAQKSGEDAKNIFLVSRKLLLKIGLVATALLLVLIFPLVYFTDKSMQSIYGYLCLLPSIIFCCFASVYRGFYEGINNMSPAAVSNVYEAVGKLIFGFGVAMLVIKTTNNPALAAAAAILGISFGSFVSALYLHLKFKKDKLLIPKTESVKNETGITAKHFLTVAFAISFAALCGSIIALIDTLTVRWQLTYSVSQNSAFFSQLYGGILTEFNEISNSSISYLELPTLLYGIRSKAFAVYNLIPTLTISIGVSAIPLFASAFSKKDWGSLKETYSKTVKMTAVITLPAAAGLIAIGPRILSLLYGGDASASLGGKMLILFGVATIFAGFCVVQNCILQGLDKQMIAMRNTMIGILLKVALNLILTANITLNIYGSVIATLCCFLVIFVLNLYSISKIKGYFKIFFASVYKPFIAAIFCGVSAFFVTIFGESSLITVFAILLAALIYFFILLISNAFTKEELSNFPIICAFFKVKGR